VASIRAILLLCGTPRGARCNGLPSEPRNRGGYIAQFSSNAMFESLAQIAGLLRLCRPSIADLWTNRFVAPRSRASRLVLPIRKPDQPHRASVTTCKSEGEARMRRLACSSRLVILMEALVITAAYFPFVSTSSLVPCAGTARRAVEAARLRWCRARRKA
jgi:hypothetical protein